MPLTETGYSRRTYDDILQDKIASAQELFGNDIETSETTPLGKFIRISAYDLALAEEEAEAIYFSIFPNTATGTSLDRLCVFAGISRNPATFSEYIATIKGKAGALVEYGFLVGTESGVNFTVVGAAETSENGKTTNAIMGDVTIGESGTVDVVIQSVDRGGMSNVTVAEINRIINPAADIESVEGKAVLSKGQDAETDYELRNRFTQAKEGLGSCNEAALKSALLSVPTVTHANVVVNDTDTTDSEGRPAKSFECFVSGGEEYRQAIAAAIFNKKPIGIKTFGKISQDITDDGGHIHTINFSQTKNVDVYVRVAIKTTAEFEGTTGNQEIKSNLKTYIDNVGISNPVILSTLYGQIHSVAGVTEVTELLLSTNGSDWSAANITVGEEESCICAQVEINQNGGGYEVVS